MTEENPAPHNDISPPAGSHELASPARVGRLKRLARFIMPKHGRPTAAEIGPVDPLEQINAMTPPTVDDFHPETGNFYQRPKELNIAAVRQAMTDTFEGMPDDKGELEEASRSLFEKLVIPETSDTTEMASIDHFLAGYPNNLVHELGDQATGSNLLAVIRTGERLLDFIDKKSADSPARLKSKTARLLTAKIPRLIARHGANAADELERVMTEQGIFAAEAYTNFQLRYKNGLPPPGHDPVELTGQTAPDSPFLREDGSRAWNKDHHMGILHRSAEWGDLGQMTAITDQWDREYGLTIMKTNEGETTLSFARGADVSVKNKHNLDKSGPAVFFHSHPRVGTGNGMYAPLISEADVRATDLSDGGGGYLNIVCGSGITLLVDSQHAAPKDSQGWVVESGELKGEVISPDGSSSAPATKVLQRLRDLQEPYTYSIHVPDDTKKLTFVHIPWSHLETSSVSLEDVCFGDGLQKVLPASLPASDERPQNLSSAIHMAKTSSARASQS